MMNILCRLSKLRESFFLPWKPARLFYARTQIYFWKQRGVRMISMNAWGKGVRPGNFAHDFDLQGAFSFSSSSVLTGRTSARGHSRQNRLPRYQRRALLRDIYSLPYCIAWRSHFPGLEWSHWRHISQIRRLWKCGRHTARWLPSLWFLMRGFLVLHRMNDRSIQSTDSVLSVVIPIWKRRRVTSMTLHNNFHPCPTRRSDLGMQCKFVRGVKKRYLLRWEVLVSLYPIIRLKMSSGRESKECQYAITTRLERNVRCHRDQHKLSSVDPVWRSSWLDNTDDVLWGEKLSRELEADELEQFVKRKRSVEPPACTVLVPGSLLDGPLLKKRAKMRLFSSPISVRFEFEAGSISYTRCPFSWRNPRHMSMKLNRPRTQSGRWLRGETRRIFALSWGEAHRKWPRYQDWYKLGLYTAFLLTISF